MWRYPAPDFAEIWQPLEDEETQVRQKAEEEEWDEYTGPLSQMSLVHRLPPSHCALSPFTPPTLYKLPFSTQPVTFPPHPQCIGARQSNFAAFPLGALGSSVVIAFWGQSAVSCEVLGMAPHRKLDPFHCGLQGKKA